MDWTPNLVVMAMVFLAAHLLLDGYRMFRHVRRLKHVRAESLDGWQCARCNALKDGMRDLRHESFWTAAAGIVLFIHLVLDFTA